MDTIIRVYYEGSTYDLELAEDLPLRLDISAIEAGELGSFFGVGSQSFYLPGTKNNNRFFQHAYNISQDDVPGLYSSIQAYVIKRGETVLIGQLQLVEVVADDNSQYVSYKCQLVDSVVSFKDELSSKLIKDADWAPYSHSIDSQSILQSWDSDLVGGAIFYPVAEYGFDQADNQQLPKFSFVPTGEQVTGNYVNNGFTPLLPLQLIPSVRVKDVINLIFDQVDYIPNGTFYNDASIQDLYILPKGQEEAGIVADPDEIPTFTAFPSYPLQSISSSAYSTIGEKVDYPNVFSNNLNKYDNINSIYEVLGIGNYTFDASIIFFNPVWNTPNQEVTIELTINAGSYPYSANVIASNSVKLTNADGFNSFTLSTGVTEFLTVPGNEVWVRCEYHYSGSTGPVPDLNIYYGNFNCSNAPQVFDGVEVDMSRQFDPTTKSLDILKGLIQQFNLVLTPDSNNERVINIDYFDGWVRDGGFKDWTDKYDTGKRKAINHTIDEIEKTIIFKQEDDQDRFSKQAVEQVPNLQYGSLEVIADNNLSQGEKTIGKYFGPLILQSPFKWDSIDGDGNPTWNLNRSINMAVPALYKLDNSSIKSFKFKPRIGYKTDIPFTNNLGMYFGNPGSTTFLTGSYSTLTNVSNYPVIPGTSKDTLFNNTYTNFVSAQANLNQSVSAFEDNWKTYIDSLYWEGSKKLTIDIEFNSNEYKDIKLNDKVFIKDNYYRINKIKGFNLTQDDKATVELIKLYPAYFQQEVIAAPVPVAPVAPVPTSPPAPGVVPVVTPAPTVVPNPVAPTAPVTPVPVTPTPATPVPIQQPRPPVTIGTFYLTQALGTSNACAFNTTTTAVYALTTTLSDLGTTVNTIYADPDCTVPFFGNGYYYGIASTPSTVPVYQLVIMGTGGISSRTDCPSFTPVPTSPGEFFRTPGNGNVELACNSSTSGSSVFVQYAPSVEYVQAGDYLYTDAQFTTTFSGSNSWYGLSNPSRYTSQMAVQVNNFGRVITRQDCVPLPPAPPPPSPVPAPIVVGTFYLSTAYGASVGCSVNADRYEVYANTTDINDILSGSVGAIYTDPNLTTGFFGNGYYYGISDISSGSAKGELVILGTGAASVSDVCETVTPAPTSPGEFRRTVGYGGTGTNDGNCGNPTNAGNIFIPYAPSIGYVDAFDYIYTDASFTTPFVGGNGWYGLSDPNRAYPQKFAQVNDNGRIITTANCVPIAPVAPIPTPAPAPTPFIYSSSISAGYLSGWGCYVPMTGSVYHDKPLANTPFTASIFYTDPGFTTPFQGGNKTYTLHQSGSTITTGSFSSSYSESRFVASIGNIGFISVYRYDCGLGGPYEFYGTTPTGLRGIDICGTQRGPIDQTYYTSDFYSVNDAQDGDKIYTNSDLTLQLSDSTYVAISDHESCFGYSTGSDARAIYYSLTAYGDGGLSLIGDNSGSCRVYENPTTNFRRFVGPSYEALEYGGDNPIPCGNMYNTWNQEYWTDATASVAGELQIGDRIYTDESGSVEFNKSYLALSSINPDRQTFLRGEEYEVTFAYTSGSGITSITYCNPCAPSPVPVPVAPTPPTQNYWRGTSFSISSGDPCIYTTPNVYYTTSSIELNDWGPGMRLYTDSGTTNEIGANNQWFAITDTGTGNETGKILVYYNQSSGVVSVTSCTVPTPSPAPAPVPVPVAPSPVPVPVPVPLTWYTVYNNGGFTTAQGCSQSVTNTRFALSQSADLKNGDKLYTAAGLGTEFDGNNYNFGIGDTANGDSEIQAFIDANGVLSSVTVCPPPPVPAPITVYTYQLSNGSSSSGTRCSATLVTTVYTSVSLSNIGLGTVVYLNSNLTNPVAGLNYYWRIGNNSTADKEVQINNGGEVVNKTNCI